MTQSPVERVVAAARAMRIEIAVREFPQGTRTAHDAARAIGVHVGQIVKSLVFIAGGRPVLCLVSGANQLDPVLLAKAAGAAGVRRASAGEVRDATGFAVGGVPPFGHRAPLTVYCDRDLLKYDTVWAAAGTPTAVFAIAPDILTTACSAIVADLKAVEN